MPTAMAHSSRQRRAVWESGRRPAPSCWRMLSRCAEPPESESGPATSRGLVPDGPDAEDSDDAAIATDKVLDENGIEEGILEKGTKRYWHPLDDEDSDGKAQHSIVIKGNKLKRERERREREM